MPFVAIHHDLHGSSFCFAVFCDLLFSFLFCCRSGIGTLSAMVSMNRSVWRFCGRRRRRSLWDNVRFADCECHGFDAFAASLNVSVFANFECDDSIRDEIVCECTTRCPATGCHRFVGAQVCILILCRCRCGGGVPCTRLFPFVFAFLKYWSFLVFVLLILKCLLIGVGCDDYPL